jgi:glucose/arabinose dehydrogenase
MLFMRVSFSHFLIISAALFISSCSTTSKKYQPTKNEISSADSINVKLQLVSNTPKIPVELNMPADDGGKSFITDNKGKIWIMNNDSLMAKPFLNLYEKIGNQNKSSVVGMIFSVAFHPQFATNHTFYVCYNALTKPKSADSKLVVAEFRSDKNNPDLADLKSEHTIIEFKGTTVQDNGAKIAFGPDGYLYISLGDDNAGDTTYQYHAQDLHYFNGKMLRIDVNKTPYAIPPGNPFIHIKNARPEIWASGFRKLWHFSFDPHSGLLFGGDVGQEKEEEIDIIKKGGNYGWPVMEGDTIYQKNDQESYPAFESPVNTYTHETGICIIGGNFYYGNDIPQLKSKYVFADWKDKLFALAKNKTGKWIRQTIHITNEPAGSFFICGCSEDLKGQLFVMGYLVNGADEKGVIYKVLKG